MLSDGMTPFSDASSPNGEGADAAAPGNGAAWSRLERLTDVSRAVTYATTLGEVLRIATDRAAELLSADKAVLMLAESDGLLHVRASTGVAAELVERFNEPLDESLAGRLQGLFGEHETGSFVGVPLVVRGRVTGLLAVVRADRSPCTAQDEWLLSAVADQTAAPIEVARLDEELRRGLRTAKERALATLAHDLRSPLQAIEGYAQLVEEEIMGPVTAEQRGALERIRMSGRHLLALQESLLELTQLREGGQSVELRPTSAAEVVRDAVSIVRPDAEAKGQTITVSDVTAPSVLADPDKLRRVLINLVSNAIKYTPAGGRITVRATRADEGGSGWGRIAVTDTGPGIDPERHDAIFEPYVRGHNAATLATPGLGLGLTICRELVEQMDGRITVESAPGCGSTFIVSLPLNEQG
jgi:signal transduction histidine kinase